MNTALVVALAADKLLDKVLEGLVKTGLLPRQFTVEPSGTLLVTNYGAGRLQAIATADLP